MMNKYRVYTMAEKRPPDDHSVLVWTNRWNIAHIEQGFWIHECADVAIADYQMWRELPPDPTQHNADRGEG